MKKEISVIILFVTASLQVLGQNQDSNTKLSFHVQHSDSNDSLRFHQWVVRTLRNNNTTLSKNDISEFNNMSSALRSNLSKSGYQAWLRSKSESRIMSEDQYRMGRNSGTLYQPAYGFTYFKVGFRIK